MSSWAKSTNHASGVDVYSRPLGNTELGFYWDHIFNGTATTIQYVKIHALDRSIVDVQNIADAWLRLKARYPLIGCRTVERETPEGVYLILDEDELRSIREGELVVRDVMDEREVDELKEQLLNGPPMDISRFTSQIWTLRGSKDSGILYIFLVAAHLITDGMGNASFIREFCQELCTAGKRTPPSSLSHRLENILSLEALYPELARTVAHKRWRWAISKVLMQIQQGKLKVSYDFSTTYSIPLLQQYYL